MNITDIVNIKNLIIKTVESGDIFFYLEILSAIIIILCIFLLFLNSKKKNSKIKQALKMTLFSVKVPAKSMEELQIDPKKQEKEWISVMEHFYASLTALKKKNVFEEDPWICLELLKVKNRINFYIAAPESYEAFIEKQIYSIIPDAEVEKVPDFNIFAPDEIVYSGF